MPDSTRRPVSTQLLANLIIALVSSLVLMPKGASAALDQAARAAVTSDQVVTLMGKRYSVCLCH